MAACGQAEAAGFRDSGEQRDIAQIGSGHCFDIPHSVFGIARIIARAGGRHIGLTDAHRVSWRFEP